MCVIAGKFLKNNGFTVSFDDRFKAATASGEQPDAIGFRNGVSCLVEVKVSRSDFLSDKNKRFRKDPSLGAGDWRFYMSPPEIIKQKDLPDGWGLLWVDKGRVKKVFGWPSNAQWGICKPFIGNKEVELSIMYSALRRVQVAGFLDVVYGGK